LISIWIGLNLLVVGTDLIYRDMTYPHIPAEVLRWRAFRSPSCGRRGLPARVQKGLTSCMRARTLWVFWKLKGRRSCLDLRASCPSLWQSYASSIYRRQPHSYF